MKTLRNLIVIVLASFVSVAMYAQDNNTASHAVTTEFNDVTILDIEVDGGNQDISLEADMSNFEAGAEVENKAYAENTDIWINWTVFAPEQGGKYEVLVESDKSMNAGWGLDLSVNDFNTREGGGNSAGTVELSRDAQRILRSIDEVAWSGDGARKGANIKYELMLRDATAIRNAGETVTVTYTIAKQ